jgi:hypothetical protein
MKKNILAENLLRFGVKNLNQTNMSNLKSFLIEATEEQWINVTAPNISVAFAAGASDSKTFINDIWTKLKAAIDANPAAKALYDAKNLALQSMTVYAGASNNFNNMPTLYDTGNYDSANDLKDWNKANADGSPYGEANMYNKSILAKKGINTKFTLADMQTGYKSNLELARKRGADIATNLKATMTTNGILIPDTTQGQYYSETIMPGVIDTGGLLDKNKESDYPYPGQMATIVVELSGKQLVTKVPTSLETLKIGLQNKSVLWGSYTSNDGVLITTFELKYLPGQGKGQDTMVMPVVRWNFEYDDKRVINKVIQIPDPGKKGVPKSVFTDFPAEEVVLNPPGKASFESQVPHVVQLLTGAGIYKKYFPA